MTVAARSAASPVLNRGMTLQMSQDFDLSPAVFSIGIFLTLLVSPKARAPGSNRNSMTS